MAATKMQAKLCTMHTANTHTHTAYTPAKLSGAVKFSKTKASTQTRSETLELGHNDAKQRLFYAYRKIKQRFKMKQVVCCCVFLCHFSLSPSFAYYFSYRADNER